MPFNIGPNALSNDDIEVTRSDNGELVIADKGNGESVSLGPDGLSTDSIQAVEASIDSLPTSLDQITGEHDNFAPTMQPRAVYDSATNRTYIASNRVDAEGSKLRVECLFFDHDDDEWSDIYHVGNVTLDRHYTGVVTVDSDGYIYLVYDARTEPTVSKTTSPHDISQWQDMGTIPDIRDYRHVATVGGDMCVWGRDGNPADGPLTLAISSDGASTWSTQTAIDSTNGMYPYGSAVSDDGTEYHVYLSARQGYSGDTQQFDYVAHVYYDSDDGEMHGTDGSVITTPADQAALDSAGSIIDTAPDDPSGSVMGSGFTLTPDGPRVSYLRGIDGDSLDWVFARWTGSAWETTGAIDNQFALDSQFYGSSIDLSEDSGTLHAYEVMSNRVADTTSIGHYTSTDDGSTWSDREAVRDFPDLQHGISKIQQAQGDGALEWLATENVDPNSSEPGIPAKMYGMDSAFGDVVAAQTPPRTTQHPIGSVGSSDDSDGGDTGGSTGTPFDGACGVYLSSDTTLTGGGSRQIPFDAVNFDRGNGFDTSTGTYTIPVSGHYRTMVTVRINDLVPDERYNLELYRGGNPRGPTNHHMATAAQSVTTRTLSMTKYFQEGQELQINLTVDSDTVLSGSGLTDQGTAWQIAPEISSPAFW